MKRLSGARIAELVRKEARQLFRDPRTRVVMFVAPIIQLIVFGYAVNTDIRNTKTFHRRSRPQRRVARAPRRLLGERVLRVRRPIGALARHRSGTRSGHRHCGPRYSSEFRAKPADGATNESPNHRGWDGFEHRNGSAGVRSAYCSRIYGRPVRRHGPGAGRPPHAGLV